MPLLLPILFAALALLSEEVGEGPVLGVEDLLARVLAIWERAGGRLPLSAEDGAEVRRLVALAWRRMEARVAAGPPSLGFLVEDPFEKRRTATDIALAWPGRDTVPDETPVLPGEQAENISRPGDRRLRFDEITRDDAGFFVPASHAGMAGVRPGERVGDPVDMAQPPRVYWVVSAIGLGRISLVPTVLNPLTSGVGAGGKQLDSFDLDVLSGRNERKMVEERLALLRAGRADVDVAKYLLLGTVPFNFGPNGAQGGWYNVSDTMANRGGRRGRGTTAGMTEEDIVSGDAWQLSAWGLAVPRGALMRPPVLDAGTWTRWVEGPTADLPVEDFPDSVTWLSYLRRMTAAGKYRYDEERLAEVARQADPGALARHLDRRLALFLRDPGAFKAKYPYDGDTLPEVVRNYFGQLERQAKVQRLQRALDIPGEDSTDPQSIVKHLRHPERRVSVRAAGMAVHRACLETVDPQAHGGWRDALLEWLRWGVDTRRGDWLAFEQAIRWAALHGDAEMLRVALGLPDPTNRRYALAPLWGLDPGVAVGHMERESHPEVLSGGLQDMTAWNPGEATRFAARRVVPLLLALPPDEVLARDWTLYHWTETSKACRQLPLDDAAWETLRAFMEGRRWR